jgi:TonB family protein
MKRFTVLALIAWLTLASSPMRSHGDTQQAFAQATVPSCPALAIVAIWPRSLAVWLLIGSDKPVTTPATIELTTESEIATYSLPSVTLAQHADDAAGGYRSAPIALAAPVGNVLSATVRPMIAAATCQPATRIVRFADASGVYNFAEPSVEDIAFEKTVMIESRGPDKTVGVTARRNAAPFDCKVAHRNVSTVRAVPPDYPKRAQELGQVGTVQVKVSVSATGAVSAASIYRSSGSEDLDGAALASARASTYAPEVVNCFAVSGTYLFRADFARQ